MVNGGIEKSRVRNTQTDKQLAMKQCTKCKEVKELTEFAKQTSNKNGLQSKCKDCDKAYYQVNKDKIKAYKQAYYQVNKDKAKAYREENKDKLDKYYKEKFQCDCGGKYTRGHKVQHQKTKKHLAFINK